MQQDTTVSVVLSLNTSHISPSALSPIWALLPPPPFSCLVINTSLSNIRWRSKEGVVTLKCLFPSPCKSVVLLLIDWWLLLLFTEPSSDGDSWLFYFFLQFVIEKRCHTLSSVVIDKGSNCDWFDDNVKGNMNVKEFRWVKWKPVSFSVFLKVFD